MSEAVAVPKPAQPAKSGTSKTVFAGVMVFVLLVAFATAFYFLGGVDLVGSLVNTWFASAPTQSANTQPPKKSAGAPAVVPTSSPSTAATSAASPTLQLPDGVDELFATRVYAEMLESQENIGRLVKGEVRTFSFGKVVNANGKATIPVTVTFKKAGKLSGKMVLAQLGGKWYLEWIAQNKNVTWENSSGHLADTADITPDTVVLNTILEQQAANQDVIGAIVSGSYTGFKCESVKKGPGTASVDITLTGPKASPTKGRVLCISKDVDGTPTWFLTSFSKQ